ncbi:Smt3-specific protease [Arthrobotrys conoides]|uniref:Smt3-specific protease n=1 Tax=Arthrobotrys conoides TaxID=74498 RepID=A0AAN8PAV4_9PEZI
MERGVMSESSITTVSAARDDSSTSSSSSSSSTSSVGSDGKDDKIGLAKPSLPSGKKKEESAIMDLATNFRSILRWWWGEDKSESKSGNEGQDDLVEERQDTGYTLKFEGNSRKRRRLTPPPEDDETPRNNGGIQKSRLHISGTTANVEPSRNEARVPRYTSEQPNSVASISTVTSVLENGTAEPVSLLEFTESKWKEQSQTPSQAPQRTVSAPSGKDQLAKSLARRNKVTQQPKSSNSLAYFRESLLNSSRVNKLRSTTPMSGSVRSRRHTSTPHRSVIGSTPKRWMEPSQYSPPSAPLNTSFRSSVGSSVGRSSTFRSSVGSTGHGSPFLFSRSMRIEQSNIRSAKKLESKKRPWLDQKKTASGDSFDGESLVLLIQKLQENKVDGFENYTQMVERQKIIDEQIKRMRTIAKPPQEVLRKITDGTMRELHVFLKDKDETKEARRVGKDPVTPRNLKTLNPSQWLNDEVINSYIHLVKERANQDGSRRMITMNSAFVSSFKESGYNRVARWARRAGAQGEEILKLKGVIIPIHRNFHWTLAFVNVEKKRFEYYDSLAGNWDPISLLRSWMKQEVGAKYVDSEWEDFYPGSQTPQQGNGYDCGVFLCKTAEVIARGGALNFSQKDIPVIRKMMQVELLKGDLAAL